MNARADFLKVTTCMESTCKSAAVLINRARIDDTRVCQLFLEPADTFSICLAALRMEIKIA